MRHRFSLPVASGLAAVFWFSAAAASACNVPVFRYALERWQSDPPEVVIFHQDDLTGSQQQTVDQLREEALAGSAAPRFDIVVRSVTGELEPDLKSRWQQMSEQATLPHVLVQHRLSGITFWQGPLADFQAGKSLRSPLLKSLADQALAGDSVTWIMMKGSDGDKASRARGVLEAELKKLEQGIALPAGIGEPGSEVFSKVPLKVAFTILEFDAADPREAFLAQLFTRMAPEAVAEGESLFVPVFGRGRALEVLAGDLVEADLVREITSFLCGACSCTVKDINPGFDLPLLVDWDVLLFENSVPQEISQHLQIAQGPTEPVTIEIPSGKPAPQQTTQGASPPIRSATEVATAQVATRPTQPNQSKQHTANRRIALADRPPDIHPADARFPRLALVGLLGLVALVIVGERFCGRSPSPPKSNEN